MARRIRHTKPSRRRSGAALVELACVLPVVLLLIVGAIDIGRAIGVQQTLTEAARAGCRLYSVRSKGTEAQVEDIIDTTMTNAGLAGYTYKFNPPANSKLDQFEPLTVTVSIPYDRVSLIPRSWFMGGITLQGVCVMPADVGE